MNNTKKRNQRSKSPQEMFKDFNKSKLQRLSKNFGRDSLGKKELEMEQKFKAVRLNKYKPQKFSNNYYLLLITILAVIMIGLLLSAVNFFQNDKQVNYCSDSYTQDGTCDPCPINTVCENGAIIQCPIGTFLQDGECVSTENIQVIKRKMRDELKSLLQYKKGDSICQGSKNLAYMKISEIEDYLRNNFRGEQYYEDAIREFLFDIRYDSQYQNIFESSIDDRSSYDQLISAKNPKYRLACSFSMALQKYRWLLILIALCILFVGISYMKMKLNKKYTKLAEKIYKENLDKFNRGIEEIDTTKILDGLKDEIKSSERDKIMQILEEIRLKDEQLGAIEKHNVLYWVKM